MYSPPPIGYRALIRKPRVRAARANMEGPNSSNMTVIFLDMDPDDGVDQADRTVTVAELAALLESGSLDVGRVRAWTEGMGDWEGLDSGKRCRRPYLCRG